MSEIEDIYNVVSQKAFERIQCNRVKGIMNQTCQIQDNILSLREGEDDKGITYLITHTKILLWKEQCKITPGKKEEAIKMGYNIGEDNSQANKEYARARANGVLPDDSLDPPKKEIEVTIWEVGSVRAKIITLLKGLQPLLCKWIFS